MQWISDMQQYLTEVLQHLNTHHGTAWSGFYTSIVFAVLLPLLVYLGRRCWGKKDKPEQPVNSNRTDVNQTSTGNGCIMAGTGAVQVVQQINPLPPPVIPHDPPTPEPCFLHREEELDWLNERLHPGKAVAVCGPGGMGKSALAAQAVSKLEPGRFPDGIVFHSFYHQPTTEQALQAIAAAFEVEAKADLETTVRQVLSGRQALLILDGAEEAADLSAVLRLRGQCGVLITSRKPEDEAGELLDLKRLEQEQAEEVFRAYSQGAGDAADIAAICELLGGWPVALRLAGRYLRRTKESAADYLRFLSQAPFTRLGSGEHQQENAALLLRRSMTQVSDDARLALSMAGTLAFAPLAREPLMAMLDNEERRSCDALNELVTYGLLERQGERWQISHALIHTYAREELALSTESLKRLAEYYMIFCYEQSAAGLEGYARLDGERTHCLRLIESCLDGGLWQEVQALAESIREYLDRQGHWADQLTAIGMRLTAAQQAGDRRDEGECLNNLGYTCVRRGELDKALKWFEQSLTIARELGERKQEGITLNNMAEIYRQQGKYELALQTYQQSLSIRREVGDRQGEGRTLNNIGMVYRTQGDNEQALSYYEQCLPIRREAGDKIGEGTTLNNMAIIYRAQGKPAKALEYREQGLAIVRELGDRALEAQLRWNIGLTYEDLGDLAKAEEYISLAVQIAKQIGHPSLEKYRDGLAGVRAARQGVRSLPRRKGLAGLWSWLRGRRRGALQSGGKG